MVALTFDIVADFSSEFAAGHLLATGAGPDGAIAAVTFDPGQPGHRTAASAILARGERAEVLALEPVAIRPATPASVAAGRASMDGRWLLRAQPLPGGGVVLVDRWCFPGEENALVFGPDGRLLRRFAVGDRVQDALLDSDSTLWVTYTDEGIADDQDALSRAGLSRFSLDGRRTWPADGCQVPFGINDCWALNVDGRDLWMVYDSTRPQHDRLLHIGPDEAQTTWLVPADTCSGLMVMRDGIFLFDYANEDENPALVAHRTGRFIFAGERLDWVDDVHLDGIEPPQWPRDEVVGRGDRVFVHRDGIWRSTRGAWRVASREDRLALDTNCEPYGAGVGSLKLHAATSASDAVNSPARMPPCP